MLFTALAIFIGSKHLSCLSLKVTFNNNYEILKWALILSDLSFSEFFIAFMGSKSFSTFKIS